MLKFYQTPLSANSRRVWVLLLEKGVEFEEIRINLNGEQFQPDFLKLNPFHHIPVLTDDELTLIESLAIIDYIEAKYPRPSFTPTDPKSIGIMRMLEMVTVTELIPATFPLLRQVVGAEEDPAQPLEAAQTKVATVLNFYQKYLGENSYLLGEKITLADIVAGTLVPALEFLNFPLEDYPKLEAWCERLMQRESWQKTTPVTEDVTAAYAGIKARLEGQIS